MSSHSSQEVAPSIAPYVPAIREIREHISEHPTSELKDLVVELKQLEELCYQVAPTLKRNMEEEEDGGSASPDVRDPKKHRQESIPIESDEDAEDGTPTPDGPKGGSLKVHKHKESEAELLAKLRVSGFTYTHN